MQNLEYNIHYQIRAGITYLGIPQDYIYDEEEKVSKESYLELLNYFLDKKDYFKGKYDPPVSQPLAVSIKVEFNKNDLDFKPIITEFIKENKLNRKQRKKFFSKISYFNKNLILKLD